MKTPENERRTGLPTWSKPEPEHESYGVVSIAHITGNGFNLFDCPVEPLRAVRLTVETAREQIPPGKCFD